MGTARIFRATNLRKRALSFATAIAVVMSPFIALSAATPSEAASNATGLVMNLDATNTNSYTSGASTWASLTSIGSASLTGVTFDSSNKMINFLGGSSLSSYGLANTGSTSYSNGMTIEFEGNFGSVGAWERMLYSSPNGTSLNDAFVVGRLGSDDRLFIEIINGSTAQGHCSTTDNQSLGTTARWTITIGGIAGNGCKIYRNGNLQNITTDSVSAASYQPPVSATRSTYIAHSNMAGEEFEGQLRYLRIYNRELLAGDISPGVNSTVTFNANGGTGSMSQQSASAPATLSANTFTKTNMYFNGWAQSGSGNSSVNSGQTYANYGTFFFTDSVTLTAQWAATTFTKTADPTVSGTARVGQTLTATAATYSGSTPTVTSNWQRYDGSTWSNIAGATSSSYVVASADVGKTLRYSQTLTNIGTVYASAATATVTLSVPDAPVMGAATHGNGQMTLNWTAGSPNGSAITSHTIEYKLSSASSWTVASSSVAANATSYTVTGLTNGVAYDFRVSSTNSYGTSATASALSQTPSTVPSNLAVPTLSGTYAAGFQVTATGGNWYSGGASTAFTYSWEVSDTSSGPWTAISGQTTQNLALQTAQVGKYVRLAETGTNINGAVTTYSLASQVIESGLANAPASLTSTASNSTLNLTWDLPNQLNGGVISNYLVEKRASGSGTWSTVTRSASTARSQQITGLTNGTAYDIRISAITAAGTGASLTYLSSMDTTPFTTPSVTAIPSLSGTVAVSRTITATSGTWNENGRTTTYTYQWESSANGTSGWTAIAGETSSSLALGASLSGKYVHVVVTATNAAGAVTSTSNASTQIQTGLPSAPQTVTATRSDSIATLSWTAPSTTNGGVISGYLIEYKLATSLTWITATTTGSSATNYTVTGLTNGNAYNLRVSAVTDAGTGTAGTLSGTVTPNIPAIIVTDPTISGTAAVALQLSTTDGTWNDGGDTPTMTYQWQVSDSGNGAWSDISGATSATFTVQSAQSSKYLRAKVIATNTSGVGYAYSAATSVVSSGLSNAPTSAASVASNGQLSLTWDLPTQLNGGVISDYLVEKRVSGSGTWSTVTRSVSTTRSQIISGLTNGSSYDIRVSAITAAGTGAALTYMSNTDTTPFTTPTVTAIPSLSGAVAVNSALSSTAGTWNNNGRTATYSYQWEVSANGSTGWVAINGATNPSYTVTSNEYGKFVRVGVVATNTAGASSASFSNPSSAVALGTHGAPQSLSVAPGDQQLNISWVADPSALSPSITGYEIQTSTDGNSWSSSTVVNSVATTSTVTGLVNGTGYQVRTRAVVGGSLGDWVVTSQPVTVRGLPLNTGVPAISGSTAYGATLTATAGTWNANGGTISSSYQWQYSNDGVTWNNVPSATSGMYVIDGYVGSTIRVSVMTTNEAGSTTSSSTASAVVTEIPAASPSITSIAAGPSQLTVSWATPTHNGGVPITGYTIQYSYDQLTWTTVNVSLGSNQAIITGLTNGNGYVVRVRAEANQPGAWSATSLPSVPVAAPSPVLSPVASASSLTTAGSGASTQTASGGIIIPPLATFMTSVMPTPLVVSASGQLPNLRSTTGPQDVTITEDGRIELLPNQSVVLVNGVQTTVSVNSQDGKLLFSAAHVQLEVSFETTADTVAQGSSIHVSGSGFQAHSPLVTWIQSTPQKIGSSVAATSGEQSHDGKIPVNALAGNHTLQINGVTADNQVVSVIYGITVIGAKQSERVVTASPVVPIALTTLLGAIVVILFVRRRKSAAEETSS